MAKPDWYCDQVIPGRSNVEVLIDDQHALAFRPDRPGFGIEHVIVVPKRHVASLLELDDELTSALLHTVKTAASRVTAEHGGCQVITTIGNEQHNGHLHFHIAVGSGVARFIDRE